MNRFKKFEESNLLQDIDFALKTQEFTSSMATENLGQAILASRAFTNILADIPTDRKINITFQYKIDIY